MGSPSNPRYTAAVHGLLARVPDDRQGVEASDQRKRKGMNPLSLITMIIKLFRNYHSFWILSNLPLRLHELLLDTSWRPHGDSNPGSHRERVVS